MNEDKTHIHEVYNCFRLCNSSIRYKIKQALETERNKKKGSDASMRKRLADNITQARYLTIAQACEYTNMGRAYCLKWCEEIGALRRLSPRMLRVDKDVLDTAMQEAK